MDATIAERDFDLLSNASSDSIKLSIPYTVRGMLSYLNCKSWVRGRRPVSGRRAALGIFFKKIGPIFACFGNRWMTNAGLEFATISPGRLKFGQRG